VPPSAAILAANAQPVSRRRIAKTRSVRWRIPASIDAQFCYAAMGEIG
jgi:hypothetical protein